MELADYNVPEVFEFNLHHLHKKNIGPLLFLNKPLHQKLSKKLHPEGQSEINDPAYKKITNSIKEFACLDLAKNYFSQSKQNKKSPLIDKSKVQKDIMHYKTFSQFMSNVLTMKNHNEALAYLNIYQEIKDNSFKLNLGARSSY